MSSKPATAFFLSAVGKLSRRNCVVLSWVVVLITLSILACVGARPGWDSAVEWTTIQTLQRGGDPYAEGIQLERTFHDRVATNPLEQRPYPYVYSPLTLPMLRLLGGFPFWLLASIYFGMVAVGYLLQLWAGFQMADEAERRWLPLALPFLAFFPGLLNSDAILSGNVAYPLYGLILASAVPGWKRGRWHWYYLAVIFASLFKLPFLVLLAFPVLVGRRQWLPACGTAAVAASIYASQFRLWPALSREYLLALRLMFEYEHDFGLSPAGILGMRLWSMGKPLSPAVMIAYLAFAAVLGIGLLFLAHRVKKSILPKEAFLPLAITGTVLFSPRINQVDVAAITVPMLLLAWRAIRFARGHNSQRCSYDPSNLLPANPGNSSARGTIVIVSGLFLILNLVACTANLVQGANDTVWKPTELFVLLGLFILGSWSLIRELHIASDQMVQIRQTSSLAL